MENRQLTELIQKSGDLFKAHGVKHLTMDEIARQLGMSKKTIYKFVDNKAALVKLVMTDYLGKERGQMDAILVNSKNSVDEMMQIVAYSLTQIRGFNSTVIDDLKKYYPETWEIFNEYSYGYVLERITANLVNGVKDGYYRNDLDVDVISKIYVAGIDVLLNQQVFPAGKYVFISLYQQYLNYYLRGIVSPAGLKILEQHKLFKN